MIPPDSEHCCNETNCPSMKPTKRATPPLPRPGGAGQGIPRDSSLPPLIPANSGSTARHPLTPGFPFFEWHHHTLGAKPLESPGTVTWLRSKGFGGGVAKSWVCSCVSPRDSRSSHPPVPPERGGGRAGWGSSGRAATCPPPSPVGRAGGAGCSQPSWVCHIPRDVMTWGGVGGTATDFVFTFS